MVKKRKVIFVGSFIEKAADGSVGGQMFACRTLINSELKDKIEFILIDSTADSVPAPPLYIRSWKALQRVLRFGWKLSTNKVDSTIIFSAGGWSLKEKGLMVFMAKIFRVKTIFAPRSGLILNDVANSSFAKSLLQRVINSSDIVLCQGATWRDFYIQFEPGTPDKFKVLNNWIDTNKYKLVNERRLKKQPNAAETPVKLLFLGWLEPYKGISEFLQAFQMILKSGYNVEVDVYGEGSLSTVIGAQVMDLGIQDKFRLLGWANETVKLAALERADIFVLPSFAEGTPNALIEAMASGLPCVSTNVGGVPDLIEHGVNGLMVNPGDVDGLYRCIVQLYQSQSQRDIMGQNACQFIQENCSVRHAVKYFGTVL